MKTQHILGLLGLAAKAGQVTAGVNLVCEGLRRGHPQKSPRIVVEASDTSENTHKRLSDKTAFYRVPHIRIPASCEMLAAAVGKREGAVGAVGVSEPHLAEAILAKWGIDPDTV